MKKKFKMLIVEDNKDELNNIYSFMIKKTDVFSKIDTASNGVEAIKKAQELKPDIILLDLILPGGKDGIDVIEEINTIDPRPKIIVTSGIAFNQTTLNIISMGVVYYILKPYNLEMVYKRVLSVLDVVDEDSLTMKISSYLHLLGISTALKGYTYIREAVYFSIVNLNSNYTLKYICNLIAKKHNTSDKSVERAIDNAIEKAMRKNTVNTYFDFFGNIINDARCKPTSSEFISMIVDKILIENKELNFTFNGAVDE